MKAPVAGEVVAINDAVAGKPGTINKDPYAQGWVGEDKTCQPGRPCRYSQYRREGTGGVRSQDAGRRFQSLLVMRRPWIPVHHRWHEKVHDKMAGHCGGYRSTGWPDSERRCLVVDGAQGRLLTGGSNHRNDVGYDPYFRIISWSGVSRITGRHSRLPCTRRWWMPAPRDQWRRVQLARFLIDYAGGHVSRMRFDAAGRLIDYGMDRAHWRHW